MELELKKASGVGTEGDFYEINFMLRGLADDVRTAFEHINDTTIYIPSLSIAI